MAPDNRNGMVILSSRPGQLGNRLLLHSHLLGFAMSHSVRIANPALGHYAEHFPALRSDPLCRFPLKRHRMGGARKRREILYWTISKTAGFLHRMGPQTRLWNIVRTDWAEPFDLDDPVFAIHAERAPLTILQGWLFRAEESVQRHAPAIRDALRPDTDITEAAERLVDQVRTEAGAVVGIHMRRGDYSQLHGGAYFYDMDQYARLIRQASHVLGDEVSFLACSDSPRDLVELAGKRRVSPGLGDPLIDLFSLAACDYLIGPPSTYTMWASFYGKTPLYIVHDPTAPFALKDFSVFPMRGYPTSVHTDGPTYW